MFECGEIDILKRLVTKEIGRADAIINKSKGEQPYRCAKMESYKEELIRLKQKVEKL